MLSIVLVLALHAVNSSTPKVDPNHELDVDIRFDARSFAAADLDRNGVLDLGEYLRAIEARIDAAIATNPAAQAKIKIDTRLEIRRKLAAEFRSLDPNSDGGISWQELAPDMKIKSRS